MTAPRPPGDDGAGPHGRRGALRRRLADLGTEIDRIHRELAALGPGEPVPGLHLVVEAAGLRALLPAAFVSEISRRVLFTPLPAAPAHALGALVARGQRLVVLDLAALAGRPRALPADAHLVVVSAVRAFALAVDRVEGVVERPLVADEPDAAAAPAAALFAATCRLGAELLPLLSVPALAASVPDGPEVPA